MDISTSDKEKTEKCKICNETFENRSVLEVHMKTHVMETKPFLCQLCGFEGTDEDDLKQHKWAHVVKEYRQNMDLPEDINLQKLQCNICENIFDSIKQLKIHMKSHSGEYPYKCNMCQKMFKEKTDLENHLRAQHPIDNEGTSSSSQRNTEGDEANIFRCKFCKQQFEEENNLKSHLKIHSDLKSVVEEMYNKNIKQSNDHDNVDKRQGRQNTLKCKECPFQTTSKQEWRIHCQRHSGGNLSTSEDAVNANSKDRETKFQKSIPKGKHKTSGRM
ncbi:zinc finger protein 182-like [Centruroides vittatus]|uniref:zinc finger protein 182-like n=1 Tax=Centruroides vittatus TaxID=120091 RepID=UPI00350F1CD4